MTLRDVRGQDEAVASLVRAIDRDRAHHAYRFEGPDGVGKELAAFGFAQAFMCTTDKLGCGACDACRRAVTLSEDTPRVPLHPDVTLIARGLYAEMKGESGKKLDEKTGISVEQVRHIILRQVGFSPSEGRARVFIVRDADEMNPNAANALLKTLEEPRPATHFVLLTSRPDKLLPTIRSRTMPIRFAPLPADVLRSLLSARGVSGDVLQEAVDLSGGSLSAALDSADPEASAKRRAFVERALAAAAAREPARAVAFAESADVDRSGARMELYGLATHLVRCAKRAAGMDDRDAAALAEGYSAVFTTTTELETANASPVLALSRLLLVLGRCGAARAAIRHAG